MRPSWSSMIETSSTLPRRALKRRSDSRNSRVVNLPSVMSVAVPAIRTTLALWSRTGKPLDLIQRIEPSGRTIRYSYSNVPADIPFLYFSRIDARSSGWIASIHASGLAYRLLQLRIQISS